MKSRPRPLAIGSDSRTSGRLSCRRFDEAVDRQSIHRMPRDESDERAERDLLELIKQREEVAEALKFATPDKAAAGQALCWTLR